MELPRQIAFWLTRLGQENPETLTCEALTGGVSGSSTYRLLAPSGAFVLKVTEAGCPPAIFARARREVAFYRHLAAQIEQLRCRSDGALHDPSCGEPAQMGLLCLSALPL